MRLALFSLIFLCTLNVFSNENKALDRQALETLSKLHPGFFKIDEKSITLKRIDDSKLNEFMLDKFVEQIPGEITTKNDFSSALNETIKNIEKIINIGKKIWAIVEKGKPVVNLKTDWASAMPEGIKKWSELHSWKKPKVQNYYYSAKNLYGVNAIDVVYRVIYTYGGSYNERGKFLTNVKVIPLKVNVLWGYSLDMNVEIPSVFNTGTKSDPIGAIELIVSTKISTMFKTAISGQTFYITGEGEFDDFEN